MPTKIAHSVQIGICADQHCRCVHIDLFDEDNNQFATAAIGLKGIPSFVDTIQKAAYEVAVTKEKE